MKKRSMLILLAALCGPFALFLCGGEARPGSADRDSFDFAAKHLDRGGVYYCIRNYRNLFTRLLQESTRLTSRAVDPEAAPEEAAWSARAGSTAEAILLLLGLDQLEQTGGSSILAGEDALGPVYRNRGILGLSGKEPRGAFWRLFGGENRKLDDFYAQLPKETLAAGFCFLDFKAVYHTIRMNSTLGDVLPAVSAKNSPDIRAKLAESMTGEYSFMVLPSGPEETELNIVVVIPDTQGVLFQLLADSVMLRRGGAGIQGNRIDIPHQESFPSWLTPVILGGDGNLTIYSSAKTIELLAADYQKLTSSEKFSARAALLPDKGCAAWYSTERFVKLVSQLECVGVSGVVDSLAGLFASDTLAVVRQESFGWTFDCIAGWEFNELDFAAGSALPLAILGKNLMPMIHREAEAKAEMENRKLCGEQLAKLGVALRAYAEKHHGAYPTPDGPEGLEKLAAGAPAIRALFQCPAVGEPKNEEEADEVDYAYFGGWKTDYDKNLPVLIDFAENHRDFFQVLFADGSVRGFELEKPAGIKRIISFLHTQYQYDAETFADLIHRAEKFDAEPDGSGQKEK
ncbi:MAG: hypothetical protein PHS41_07675 [Victivallaceae bacterium]|nr:hypothetical protein [Victivallaceae bacterium]